MTMMIKKIDCINVFNIWGLHSADFSAVTAQG